MRCYCVMQHGQPLQLINKAVPEPQGTEVLLRVTAAGLCHTDLHLWEGSYDMGGGITLSLPVTCRPLAEANQALQDLHHGKVIGRTILVQ